MLFRSTSTNSGPTPEPDTITTASQPAITPATEGLPVVRIPPPNMRGINGESLASRTRPDPSASNPNMNEGSVPKYRY